VLVAPRGYCAGVERAVEVVEVVLERWGPPIYVRKQIVHNLHVVRDLESRGAVFVESEEDVPVGARIVFSAHGVSRTVRERARARWHRTIYATCPLVAKVHAEARHYAARGYSIVLIGHVGQ
jgi:4-hydroxy-3-methylbut-2-enyl diphosphate reductase